MGGVEVVRMSPSLPNLDHNQNQNQSQNQEISENPDNYYDDQYANVKNPCSFTTYLEESGWQVISEEEKKNTVHHVAIGSLIKQFLGLFDQRKANIVFEGSNRASKIFEIDQQILLDISRTMPISVPVQLPPKQLQVAFTSFLGKIEALFNNQVKKKKAVLPVLPVVEKRLDRSLTSQWKINGAPAPRDIEVFIKKVYDLSGCNEELVHKVTQIYNQRVGIDLFRMAHLYCEERGLIDNHICSPLNQKFNLDLIISTSKAVIVGKSVFGAFSRDEVETNGELKLQHKINVSGDYDLHSEDVEYSIDAINMSL